MSTQDTSSEQAEKQEKTNSEQTKKQEAGGSQGKSSSPANVFEFLRKSNIINSDMPLKTLFESIEALQPDPSSGWGVVGDSGHLVLVWKGQQ
jgi:hypothetical protein